MSRRQRKTREKRRRHAPLTAKRVRNATLSGSLAATAALGLAADTEPAEAQGFDAALVRDINATANSDPSELFDLGGTLFFSASDGPSGHELWRSNGTEAGTTRVKDINMGAGSSYPRYLTDVGGTLFFQAGDGVSGTELWRSNGTEAGTTLVKDINMAGSSDPDDLTEVGGTLFFRAIDGPDNGTTHGIELWKAFALPGPPAGSSASEGATCRGRPATIVGTPGPDTLIGTPGPDVIQGLDGNDVAKGRGDKDLICGGAGDDTLRGGAASDTVVGGPDSDLLFGGKAVDRLFGGSPGAPGSPGGPDTLGGDDDRCPKGAADILHGCRLG